MIDPVGLDLSLKIVTIFGALFTIFFILLTKRAAK